MALSAAGIVLALVLGASDDFGRRYKAEALILRSRWVGWYIDSPFRIDPVDDEDLYACSLAGQPPEIYLSTGIRRVLTSDECASIIVYEKSHVLRRHNFVIRVATVNSACLPRQLAVSRRFRTSVLALVEMIADDDAAQTTSAASINRAFESISGFSGDASLRLRSLRLRRIHLGTG